MRAEIFRLVHQKATNNPQEQRRNLPLWISTEIQGNTEKQHTDFTRYQFVPQIILLDSDTYNTQVLAPAFEI